MLILARHGQTTGNAAGLLVGRADLALTELGRRQAVALGVMLGGAQRVVSSSLSRARETAASLGRPVDIDDRWIELDYGDLDERPMGDVPASTWDRWRRDTAYVPAGGESLAALGARVREACDSLAEEASTADVVVVTHVSPIKAAVAWALGVGDEVVWRLRVEPASITRIAMGPAGPVLTSFNEVAHLS